MNELVAVEKIAEWQRLKALVLDSVSSPITRRVYNMALNEFMAWFRLELRPGFSKATVSAWRASLEVRKLGSSSIIIRMSAIRKLAGEAADNGLLAPELATGISRVKSVKSTGIRVGNWLSLRQAHAVAQKGEFGNDTWEGDSWKNRAAVNAWSILSVDTERGIVFLPLTSPAYDICASRVYSLKPGRAAASAASIQGSVLMKVQTAATTATRTPVADQETGARFCSCTVLLVAAVGSRAYSKVSRA